MERKIVKITKNYHDLIKNMTDKQAGEFVKGVCAYVYEGKPFITKDEYLKGLFVYVKRELDVSEMYSVNGKRGADKRLEIKRRNKAIGVIVGSVLVANAAKKESEKRE